ncbi:MAG: AbrB/MazE/SpoVT family DNA-binding domain-containing protein [Candidatus Methanosuratus sp.]|nr:AbrB/MazE/SpoVT family DNA-binding domain-containing protein [Candidatus Methanosuratincola sp.]
MSHTVTEKGTVTIPARIRKKYGLRKGSRVEFIETDGGVMLIPIAPLESLFGADAKSRDEVLEMVRELHKERRREASGEG